LISLVTIDFSVHLFLIKASSLNLHFSEGTEEVKNKTQEAKKMLMVWKDSYFEVRAKIEASGRDQRWEFDRKKLFERTDYMANICQNLYDVAEVYTCNLSFIYTVIDK